MPRNWLQIKVELVAGLGEEFRFVFDFGDRWEHRCQVLEEKVDPREVFGETPRGPMTLDGWGWLPDQYGRESEGGEAE